MSNNKKNTKTIIAVAVLLVLVIGAFAAWKLLSPAPRDRHPEAAAAVTAAPAQENGNPDAEPADQTAADEAETEPAEEAPSETAQTEAAENAAEPAATAEEETAAAESETDAAETSAEPAETAGDESAAAAEADEDLVTITVTITHKDGSARDVTITTGALTLLDAMLEQDLLAYENGEWGAVVTAVDGEAADMDNNEWWMIYTDKEWTQWTDSVDIVYIADGDHYEFVYMVF